MTVHGYEIEAVVVRQSVGGSTWEYEIDTVVGEAVEGSGFKTAEDALAAVAAVMGVITD